MNDEDFDALRCIVNFARNQVRCSLKSAREHAVAQGFSQESVENSVKFWEQYEAKKVYHAED